MKKTLSLIPLFSGIVFVFALLKVYIFYNNFNVPIKYFINISELTIIVFEDLVKIVPPFLLLYFIVDKTDPKIDVTEIKERFKKTIDINLRGKKLVEKVKLLIPKILTWFSLMFSILLFVGFPIFIILFHRTYSEEIFGFTLLGIEIFLFIFITKSKVLIKSLTLDGMILSLFIAALTFFFVLRILVDIQNVEDGKFVGSKIITEDSTYISTTDNYYIGQTSTYVFIFNDKQNQSVIIPTSKIKQIELSIKK